MSDFAHAVPDRSNPPAHRGAASVPWRELFRAIFPEKTAANVAAFARTKVRAAEYVVAGESEPSTRALINLLRSPIGDRVLDALTRDVDWRSMERRRLEIAVIEQELEELERKRRELARR